MEYSVRYVMVLFFIFGSKPYNLAVLDLALFEKGEFAGGMGLRL